MSNSNQNHSPITIGELCSKVDNIEKMLLGLNPTAQPDEFIDIHQAASFIKLSVNTIYGLVSRSKIPHHKQGRKLYFLTTDLASWIKSGKKKEVSNG